MDADDPGSSDLEAHIVQVDPVEIRFRIIQDRQVIHLSSQKSVILPCNGSDALVFVCNADHQFQADSRFVLDILTGGMIQPELTELVPGGDIAGDGFQGSRGKNVQQSLDRFRSTGGYERLDHHIGR